jgi:protein-S-isoprenylcysteine O-methyltransferase Ste14
VAIQAVIFLVIALGGSAGPAWDEPWRTVTSALGVVCLVLGMGLAAWGLSGLRGALTPFPRPREGAELVVGGAYALVRHPVYGGLIVGSAGWGLLAASFASLAGAAVLFAFFDLKSRREEAWLEETVDGYAEFRRGRRRLIPFVY